MEINIHNFYKKKYDIKRRLEISKNILKNNYEVYPLIIQPNTLKDYSKEYYAFRFRGSMNLICWIKIINKSEKFKKDESLYFMIYKEKKIILNSRELIKNLYQNYKDEDGFLYVYYSKTDSFGIH